MTRLFHSLLGALIILAFAVPAHAGKRKVTTYEYDSAGRPIKVQVYDDVGAAGELVSESETEYDSYGNVVAERQIAAPYDRSRLYNFKSGVLVPQGDSRYMLEQRYAYEDTKWPTKVTKKYNPRYAFQDAAFQEQMATQYFYDNVTGVQELEYSSDFYCTNGAVASNTAESFGVDRNGATQTVKIKK